MFVTIAGCGALGSIFASGIVKSGIDVQIYQRKGLTLDSLREQGGVRVRKGDRKQEELFPFSIITDRVQDLEPSDLILVLVKSYSTKNLVPLEGILKTDGAVLTLQNGLGNAEILSDIFGKCRIAAGVATYGAYRISPGMIQAAGEGLVSVGPWQSGIDRSWITDLLSEAGFNAEYVADPRPYIWRKLAVNAMVNTTAALTRMKNGDLIDNPLILELMKSLGHETLRAAERDGVQLDFDELWEFFMLNLKKTASNKPSMLQDIEAERKTEIESISGGILKYATDENDLPFTRSVYSLIRAIDRSRGFN